MRQTLSHQQAKCGGSVDLIFTLVARFFALLLVVCVIGCGRTDEAAQPQTSGDIVAVTNPEADPYGLPPIGTVFRHTKVDASIEYLGQIEDYPAESGAGGISIDGSYYLVFIPDFVEQVVGDTNLIRVTPTHR